MLERLLHKAGGVEADPPTMSPQASPPDGPPPSSADRFDGRGEAQRLVQLGRAVRAARDAPRPTSGLEHNERTTRPAAGGYFRLQPPCHGVSPIETDEARLVEMERATRDYFRQSDVAAALCASMAPSSRRGP